MKRGVAGLGACVFDTLISVGSYPEEDRKVKADDVLVSGGGPVANALVVISKLGVETEILGCIADDKAGDYIAADFEKYGVSTKNAVRVKGARSFTSYILLSGKTKTRTCVFDRGDLPDGEKNVAFSAIDDKAVLHLDGNYLKSALAAAKYARERRVKVSLDAGGLYEGIGELLPLVDILIPSAEFALGFTGEKTVRGAVKALYEKYRPEVLVVTSGKDGGYYIEDGAVKKYDGIKVEAVDTNGAGDTFHGAFLAAYVGGKTVGECCDFASRVAAYKCAHKGARDYPLSLKIVKGLLK